jgi:hypothetical protein
VIGVDIHDFSPGFPGEFIQADLLTWEGWKELRPDFICASAPCEEFSRHDMPWTRAKNPPAPSLALVKRCEFIARSLGVPMILENVRGAQKWLGKSIINAGPFHFWGCAPALLPKEAGGKKQRHSGRRRAERAFIPLNLARYIARFAKNL